MAERNLIPAFVPKSQDNFDPRTLGDWKDEIDHTIDLESSQSLFIGYIYDKRVFAETKGGHKKSLSLV